MVDVIGIDNTEENCWLIYDTKDHFAVNCTIPEEAKYNLYKVRRIFMGTKGISHLMTHDVALTTTLVPSSG